MNGVFTLLFSYAQIAVFNAEMETPFNNWTDRHVAQGFAWRPGSVSFAVPLGGEALVEILLGDAPPVFVGEPSRIIMTPYAATGRSTAVASIGDERTVPVPGGDYQLTFELIPELVHEDVRYDYGIRLRFAPAAKPVSAS